MWRPPPLERKRSRGSAAAGVWSHRRGLGLGEVDGGGWGPLESHPSRPLPNSLLNVHSVADPADTAVGVTEAQLLRTLLEAVTSRDHRSTDGAHKRAGASLRKCALGREPTGRSQPGPGAEAERVFQGRGNSMPGRPEEGARSGTVAGGSCGRVRLSAGAYPPVPSLTRSLPPKGWTAQAPPKVRARALSSPSPPPES